jgi:glycosyltransferase involved in cell wall biosynthesis
MTDPYGQSQVINYLIRLSRIGYQFDILSLEKPEKLKSQGSYIKELLSQYDIGWHPQTYHNVPPILSKIYDKENMISAAKRLHKRNKYDLIHARSYPAAEIAQKLKKNTGVKFLFDMRGFWPDEKADGNHWNQKKWFWRKVYNFYKRKEKEFIQQADHIISLTRAGKTEIEAWSFYNYVPIAVIPCCADENYFLLTSKEKKENARHKLSIDNQRFVLSYLGSLGTWYMIDEMLLFFSELKKKNSNSFFLIITNSDHQIIIEKLESYGLKPEDVKTETVSFKQVAEIMYASDVSISFIKPAYSKMSSSPIKVGEILSMGIPMIANNIGDSGTFIEKNKLGIMLDKIDSEEIRKALQKLDSVQNISPEYIRRIAVGEYSVTKGVDLYSEVYQKLLG